MDNYTCHNCMWEGTEEELGTIFTSNRHNPQDHTLYEENCCPDCRTNEGLVNVDEDRRYEERAHRNYYDDQI